MHHTHVFLGPSLNYATAVTLLPEAHYHPPIQCGDIIRLLRLEPKKIIIIDGLYETVPTVWHKEILLAMELGVEIWGASSMGALRAAELHLFGMNGYGCVFEDFKAGILSDDDEVAVLHRGHEDGFSSINDAMINIRYTCRAALEQGIISLTTHDALIDFCKAQFYPYRSLIKAVKALEADEGARLNQWLLEHGMVDIKRQDAIEVLTYHHQQLAMKKPPLGESTPITVFLKELTYYSNLLPFEQRADWLPSVEKQLQRLHSESLSEYKIMAEIAHFTRRLRSFATDETRGINNDALLLYIQQKHLYNPEPEFKTYADHDICREVYQLICQSVCMEHLKIAVIDQYLPIVAHYYELDQDTAMQCQTMLRVLMVLIISIDIRLKKFDTKISEKSLSDQLRKMMQRRQYSKEQFAAWLNPPHIDEQRFISFLSIYYKITSSYNHEARSSQMYFKWIYAAFDLYLNSVKSVSQSNKVWCNSNAELNNVVKQE